MTHYQLSRSPYLNQLINNLFMELQTKPQGGELNSLQNEIIEEITHSTITIDGQEVEMQEIIENSQEDESPIFPELMSFVLMKVIFKMKDKAICQFLDTQERNAIHYKIIVEPHDVFRNFIHNGFYEFTQKSSTRAATIDFIQLISKKYQEKIMMLDDFDNKQEISYGKMILLEDASHIVMQVKKEQQNQFTSIIMDLLLKDKKVKDSFTNILKSSFNEQDSKTIAFTRALVKDYISLTVKKLSNKEPFYTEQPLQRFINHLRGKTCHIYLLDNEKEIEPMDFVRLLASKQFNPSADNYKIKEKLGII